MAAACGSMLATAAALAPSADGLGTHEQLGLPPCSFQARTGWPCPTCGATTSVALTVRGRLIEAWTAQPFGVLLAGALAAGTLAGAAEAASGRPRLPTGRGRFLLAAGLLAAGLALGWAWKLADGFARGGLPPR